MAANPLMLQLETPPTLMRRQEPVPTSVPEMAPFGALLRAYRVRCGLSQNALARRSGCDPAYVNRLERATTETTATPSRPIVLRFWETLVEASAASRQPISTTDREQLLVTAGLCPETILAAGDWVTFVTGIRRSVIIGLATTVDQLDAALEVVDP